MRGASAREVSRPASSLLAPLEQHRDHHFRRTKSRRVTGEKSALAFINEVGFCTGFTAGRGVPCLREAIAGEREPITPEHIQHDYAIGMTWRIKDSLPAQRLVYYGKVIGGRPGFVSLDLLPAFLRLRVEPGGYQKLYRRGMLSACARSIMEALSKRGPSETRALKLGSGYSGARARREFDNAMRELQEKFLALKIEERYEPFTYVWDTFERRWPEAIRESREMSKTEAALRVLRRYFQVAAFGNERAVARILSIDSLVIEAAMRKLELQKLLWRDVRIQGLAGKFSLLREFCH